jgi:hypothetical protein
MKFALPFLIDMQFETKLLKMRSLRMVNDNKVSIVSIAHEVWVNLNALTEVSSHTVFLNMDLADQFVQQITFLKRAKLASKSHIDTQHHEGEKCHGLQCQDLAARQME